MRREGVIMQHTACHHLHACSAQASDQLRARGCTVNTVIYIIMYVLYMCSPCPASTGKPSLEVTGLRCALRVRHAGGVRLGAARARQPLLEAFASVPGQGGARGVRHSSYSTLATPLLLACLRCARAVQGRLGACGGVLLTSRVSSATTVSSPNLRPRLSLLPPHRPPGGHHGRPGGA
jgi:hypothetical protein